MTIEFIMAQSILADERLRAHRRFEHEQQLRAALGHPGPTAPNPITRLLATIARRNIRRLTTEGQAA
jgi:hypothetical protein